MKQTCSNCRFRDGFSWQNPCLSCIDGVDKWEIHPEETGGQIVPRPVLVDAQYVSMEFACTSCSGKVAITIPALLEGGAPLCGCCDEEMSHAATYADMGRLCL